MSLVRDAIEALKKVILMEDRIRSMSGKIERLAAEMVEMDKRLVAMEAKFELMVQMAAGGRRGGSQPDGAALRMLDADLADK